MSFTQPPVYHLVRLHVVLVPAPNDDTGDVRWWDATAQNGPDKNTKGVCPAALGSKAILAPEQAVVLEKNPDKARAIARGHIGTPLSAQTVIQYPGPDIFHPNPEFLFAEGAVLVTPLGKGAYVYTTLALFRQLPAGVPGAARIFLNLLAADGRSSASAAAHP